jgi:hypothetical protein
MNRSPVPFRSLSIALNRRGLTTGAPMRVIRMGSHAHSPCAACIGPNRGYKEIIMSRNLTQLPRNFRAWTHVFDYEDLKIQARFLLVHP